MGWGLLQGLGQGLNQAGTMLMSNHFDKMKEERLRNFQSKQSAQDRSFSAEQNRLTREHSAEQAGLDRKLTEDNANRAYELQSRQFAHEVDVDNINTQIAQQNLSNNSAISLANVELALAELREVEAAEAQREEIDALADKAKDFTLPESERQQYEDQFFTMKRLLTGNAANTWRPQIVKDSDSNERIVLVNTVDGTTKDEAETGYGAGDLRAALGLNDSTNAEGQPGLLQPQSPEGWKASNDRVNGTINRAQNQQNGAATSLLDRVEAEGIRNQEWVTDELVKIVENTRLSETIRSRARRLLN